MPRLHCALAWPCTAATSSSSAARQSRESFVFLFTARSALMKNVYASANTCSGPGGSAPLHIGHTVPTLLARSCVRHPWHMAWLQGSLTGNVNTSRHTGHSSPRSSAKSVTATGCCCGWFALHSRLWPAFQCWRCSTPDGNWPTQ